MSRTTEPGSEKSSTPPGPETASDPVELLRRLQNASAQQVDRGARKAAEYSEDDDAHNKRWQKAESRRTFFEIKRDFFKFLFWLLVAACVVFVAGYFWLVYLWLDNLVWGTKIKDPSALKDVITDVLWTLLVIMATLFGEKIFAGKDD